MNDRKVGIQESELSMTTNITYFYRLTAFLERKRENSEND